LRIWNSYDEIVHSGYVGLVTIRYKETLSKFLTYNAAVREIPALLESHAAKGAHLSFATFNEAAPDDHLIIQGEYMILDDQDWFFTQK
jgi:hypothetical protein